MTHAGDETAVLDTIVPGLQADGYEVFIHPSQQMLPSFMERYLPDAIALKSGKRFAIEVLRDSPSAHSKLDFIRRLFEDKTDWELLVYWIGDSTIEPDISSVDLKSIESALREVEYLLEQGLGRPALLQAWATLEAAARSLSPELFSRPQPTSRIIETLASTGLVTPTEADKLRAVARVRNSIAHGDLGAAIPLNQVRDLLAVTRTMVSEARPLS